MSADKQRWDNLCEALGLSLALAHDEFDRLVSAYSEPHRAYHTLQHLSECMDKLDWANAQHPWEHSAIAEVALWYHDAVYQPRANDNELQSAKWASQFLSQSGLSIKDCEWVHSLIMATCHGEKPEQLIHQLVVDIDLSILGADSSRFDQYEQQVRQEYRWVPWLLYKKKRRELLQHFLQAPKLYNTELFYQHFEQQARHNLMQSIAKLSG